MNLRELGTPRFHALMCLAFLVASIAVGMLDTLWWTALSALLVFIGYGHAFLTAYVHRAARKDQTLPFCRSCGEELA